MFTTLIRAVVSYRSSFLYSNADDLKIHVILTVFTLLPKTFFSCCYLSGVGFRGYTVICSELLATTNLSITFRRT